MTTMNADETLLAYLGPLREETFIRDKNGRVIGRYVPGGLTDEEVYAHAHEFLDVEEAKRRKAAMAGRGLATEELLARLHASKEKS